MENDNFLKYFILSVKMKFCFRVQQGPVCAGSARRTEFGKW